MKELNELIEKLKAMELKLLDQKETINKAKKTLELSLLQRTTLLEKKYQETKDKELSTIQKRESIAKEEPSIGKLMKDIETLELEVKHLDIEYSYLKRKLRISEYEFGTPSCLKDIAKSLREISNKIK